MKKNLFKLSLVFVLVWFFLFAGQAKAEDSVTVRLQIKTRDASLYDQDITVTACEDSATASTTSINAKCAILQSGLASDWSFWGEDAFLNSIGAYVNNADGNGVYWAWFSDLVYGEVALNKHLLINGEKLLLTYNVNPLKISVNNASPYVNATSTITVEQFGLDANWSPVWTPAADSLLMIGAEESVNASGIYEYVPSMAGEKIIYAKKDGYVDSESLNINAVATKNIRLQIKTRDASLYDQDMVVSACADSPTASTTSVNAKCAVEQSGLASDWSFWGEDAFLNSIGAYVNNADGNGVYWAWFGDLVYGEVSLNKHVLVNGEKLLLTYNTNPLKISVDNAAPYVNATSTITVKQFGLDENWSPVWSPAASSTLVIAGQDAENDSGNYLYTATVAESVVIYAKKDGYVDSGALIITAQARPNENNNQTQSLSGGSVIIPATGGGAPAAPAAQPAKLDLNKAVNFLINKQSADGSFGSVMITDWAALALASANPSGPAGQKVKSYLLADTSPLVGMNPVSDYARRAMALMSFNISPYDGVKTDYVKKIADLFDGSQFGDASLYNDDIFALLVLYKAGYTADDEIIKKTVSFVIARQQADGSWNGTDLTAAAIQALKPVSAINGVSAALAKARNFLANAQGADGGFGNTFTTPWVMQAIAALSESGGSWQKNNNTPESYLALSQGADGGLEKDSDYENNRIWSTAYAIPAVKNLPWFSIMNGFSKADSQAVPAANYNLIDNRLATSTLEKLDIATSTPENLIAATSAPEELMDEVKQMETADAIDNKIKTVKITVAPKVLAEKITSARPKKVVAKKIENKPAEIAAPTAGVNETANLDAPADDQAEPKAGLLTLTGQLIYRGLKYILNLFGF